MKKQDKKINMPFRNRIIIAVCCMAAIACIGAAAIGMSLTEPSAASQVFVSDLQTAIKVIDNEGMDTIRPYMQDNLILQVTKQLGGSSTRKEFIDAYLKLDSDEDLEEAIITAGNRSVGRAWPEDYSFDEWNDVFLERMEINE